MFDDAHAVTSSGVASITKKKANTSDADLGDETRGIGVAKPQVDTQKSTETHTQADRDETI